MTTGRSYSLLWFSVSKRSGAIYYVADKKVGIVLSSGGGRGIYGHTGFMLALDKLNIEIKAMSGCSAGAIVGSVVASGGSIKDWSEALREVSVGKFWTPKSKLKLLYYVLIRKGKGLLGLSSSKAATEFISRYLRAKTFEQCRISFYAVAINIGNGEKVIFDSKELAPRVIASAAMPVFFEPVEIGGEYFSDGAAVDLAPSEAICCRHGLDLVIIHHLANRKYTIEQLKKLFNKPWSIAGILYRLIYRHRPWYETGEAVSRQRCPCGCNAEIVIIEPSLPDLKWPVIKGGVEIMESAEKQAQESLSLIFKGDGALH